MPQTPGMQYLSLNSRDSGGISTTQPSDYPTTSQTHATAITSQDGTVTINIRQPEQPAKRSSGHPVATVTKSSKQASAHPSKGSGTRPSKTVREVFYSSDPNEEFVDSETVSVFVDKDELQNQYDRAVYHGKCYIFYLYFFRTEFEFLVIAINRGTFQRLLQESTINMI